MEQNISNDNFKLWTKWFWIGIIIALANLVLGLIYGLALVIEKDKRKEGIIIIAFSVIWIIFASNFLLPWLSNAGILPHYQLLQIR
ncbi:MAG: hypothetical protein ABIG99_02060 [Patescibacteria group bacterium]